jgi:hypothetical protein
MAVPEAAVNEDHLFSGGEYEIRFAWEIFTVKTETIPKSVR